MTKNESFPKQVNTSKSTNKTMKKKQREVQVVSCPSAFPISKNKKRSRDSSNRRGDREGNRDQSSSGYKEPQHQGKHKSNGLLDWDETVKEVRGYGAKAFSGKQKRDYDDEQYFTLTGRHKKKQKVPLPIVRGINKAAKKRLAKEKQEARDAGIVLPKSVTAKEQKQSKADSTIRSYGPAPNIGFMKGGVYRVSSNKGDRKKGSNRR